MKKIKKFLHDFLRLGFPKERVDGDCFQPNYSCQFCDEEITQDSTGAWFYYSDYKS